MCTRVCVKERDRESEGESEWEKICVIWDRQNLNCPIEVSLL